MPFPLLKLDIIVDLGFRTDVGKGHWLRGGKLSDDALAFRIESEMVNTDSYVRQRNVLDEKQRRLLRWVRGLGLSCDSATDPKINPAMESVTKVFVAAPRQAIQM